MAQQDGYWLHWISCPLWCFHCFQTFHIFLFQPSLTIKIQDKNKWSAQKVHSFTRLFGLGQAKKQNRHRSKSEKANVVLLEKSMFEPRKMLKNITNCLAKRFSLAVPKCDEVAKVSHLCAWSGAMGRNKAHCRTRLGTGDGDGRGSNRPRESKPGSRRCLHSYTVGHNYKYKNTSQRRVCQLAIGSTAAASTVTLMRTVCSWATSKRYMLMRTTNWLIIRERWSTILKLC